MSVATSLTPPRAGSAVGRKLSLLGNQVGMALIFCAPLKVDCCNVEMTVTSKSGPFSSRGGRCRQAGFGCRGLETGLPFGAPRQLTELLKKLHHEGNYVGGFYHTFLHNPLDGPQRGRPRHDTRGGTLDPPRTSGDPTSTAGRIGFPDLKGGGPGLRMGRHLTSHLHDELPGLWSERWELNPTRHQKMPRQ